MLLSLRVIVVYVLVIGCDIDANKCHHHCDINVAITVCSAPTCCCHCMWMLHMCRSLYVMLLIVNDPSLLWYKCCTVCSTAATVYVALITYGSYICVDCI